MLNEAGWIVTDIPRSSAWAESDGGALEFNR